MTVAVRLTDLSGSGGHGRKLAPAMLDQILARIPVAASFPNLLVGTETADDAAVYRLNDQQAVVATLDFFAPVVDDPEDFGRIAATNALSDIYAMGGKPILALAIVGMPVETLPLETVQAILAGGAAVCAAAGIPVAGGHSIAAQEPIYGLVVLGLVNPNRILRNSTAQPGDRLILTKRLGTGIFTVALKRGELDAASYRDFLAATTQLNAVGAELPGIAGVHAVTDVTGFGLLEAPDLCSGREHFGGLESRDRPAGGLCQRSRRYSTALYDGCGWRGCTESASERYGVCDRSVVVAQWATAGF